MSDPILRQPDDFYHTFTARPKGRSPSSYGIPLACLVFGVVLVLNWSPLIGAGRAFIRLRPNVAAKPLQAYPGEFPVARREASAPRTAAPCPARPEAEDDKRWWRGVLDQPLLPTRKLSPATLRTLFTFASGVALFLDTMSPRAAEAVTSMVTPEYMTAAATSIQDTVTQVNDLMEHALPAPTLRTSEVVGSVNQVFKKTVNDLWQLAAADTIGDIPKQDWFGQFVGLIEGSILGLDKVLAQAHVPGSLGLAITLFTMGVKAILFPVNFAQLKSSVQMQTMQPKVKELQERFADNPQKLNLMLAELYKKNDVNPLIAIFPAFAQIPVFIGLYRALKHLGDLNLLDEPFLWLPSLEGPTFDLPPGHTLDWLTQGMLPQQDTIAYLTIPLILVATQTASTQLGKIPGQEIPVWINFLPLLTASFALNVPSGLAVYWIVNTIITTATNLGIKAYLKNDPGILASAETDLDALDTEQPGGTPAQPSYQEALLKAIEVDPTLADAFAEMRQSPTSVMKYYGDKEFTARLAEAVQKQQLIMIQENEAKVAEAKKAAAVKVSIKVKANLCTAVKDGNMTSVKAFLDEGVDPNFKDERDISALHYAVGKGRLDFVKLLVDSGADVNIVDGQRNTLLHYAAGYGRDDIIKYLGEKGVDFTPENTLKETPLDLAKREENKFADKKTLELLRKYGAKEGIGFGPLAPELLDEAETRKGAKP